VSNPFPLPLLRRGADPRVLSSTKITFWLLPADLADILSFKASTFLVLAIAFEVLGMSVPFMNRRTIDYVAHLAGYCTGILGGLLWKRDHGGSAVGPWGGSGRHKEPRWYEKFLGR
jgi:Rhomboid family